MPGRVEIEIGSLADALRLASYEVVQPDRQFAAGQRAVDNARGVRRPARSLYRRDILRDSLRLAATERHDPELAREVHRQPPVRGNVHGKIIAARERLIRHAKGRQGQQQGYN